MRVAAVVRVRPEASDLPESMDRVITALLPEPRLDINRVEDYCSHFARIDKAYNKKFRIVFVSHPPLFVRQVLLYTDLPDLQQIQIISFVFFTTALKETVYRDKWTEFNRSKHMRTSMIHTVLIQQIKMN